MIGIFNHGKEEHGGKDARGFSVWLFKEEKTTK
jgi:hypothetical protein